ncbi:MAG: alkene reductase [Burkholderiaceae bacterium]
MSGLSTPAAASSAHNLDTRLHLFTPLQVGAFELKHRIVMAPLTRMRANRPGNEPSALNALYYTQRASEGGLIIAEASQVVPEGQGMPATPGIHTDAQQAGWQLVTDGVHARGGRIFLQLWHVGRISHSSHQPEGGAPVAPSAIAAVGNALTADFTPAPFEVPRALSLSDIEQLKKTYVAAGRRAIAAGFDGVEIHSANGYLLEQFMISRSNERTDRYGGSLANRMRLPLEIAELLAADLGANRVGIRLSPFGVANDSGETDPLTLYREITKELNLLKLAYLHLIEPRASGAGQRDVDHQNVPSGCATLRPFWDQVLITAGNFNAQRAEQTVAAGEADAIAFGRYFISNPDLPQRIKNGVPFTPYDRPTFYGGGTEGYTNYAAFGG